METVQSTEISISWLLMSFSFFPCQLTFIPKQLPYWSMLYLCLWSTEYYNLWYMVCYIFLWSKIYWVLYCLYCIICLWCNICLWCIICQWSMVHYKSMVHYLPIVYGEFCAYGLWFIIRLKSMEYYNIFYMVYYVNGL